MKLVVFDMAGTTVDERNVVYEVMTASLVAAGVEVELEAVVAVGAGQEKRSALARILAAHEGQAPDAGRVDRIFRDFERRLDAAYEVLAVKGLPGAEAVFGALRDAGVKVVLNTGYARRVAEGLIARLGWRVGAEIHGLVAADDVGRSRPDPAMIQRAMATFGVTDAREVAKVGDTVADILEGRNAGCGLSIGVTTGAQTREALAAAAPDAIVDRLVDILALVGVVRH